MTGGIESEGVRTHAMEGRMAWGSGLPEVSVYIKVITSITRLQGWPCVLSEEGKARNTHNPRSTLDTSQSKCRDEGAEVFYRTPRV